MLHQALRWGRLGSLVASVSLARCVRCVTPQTRKFEASGLSRQQAEQLAEHITAQVVLDRMRLSEKFVAKAELEKVGAPSTRSRARCTPHNTTACTFGAAGRSAWVCMGPGPHLPVWFPCQAILSGVVSPPLPPCSW